MCISLESPTFFFFFTVEARRKSVSLVSPFPFVVRCGMRSRVFSALFKSKYLFFLVSLQQIQLRNNCSNYHHFQVRFGFEELSVLKSVRACV